MFSIPLTAMALSISGLAPPRRLPPQHVPDNKVVFLPARHE